MLARKDKIGLQLYDEENDSRCYIRINYFNRNLGKPLKWTYKGCPLLPKLTNYFCRTVLVCYKVPLYNSRYKQPLKTIKYPILSKDSLLQLGFKITKLMLEANLKANTKFSKRAG